MFLRFRNLSSATLAASLLLYCTEAQGGLITTQTFTRDGDSGILSTKTYTHAIDLNGQNGDYTINGVLFHAGANGDQTSTLNYNLQNTPSNIGSVTDNGHANNIAGDIHKLTNDFFYDGSSTEHLILTGLQPDTHYVLTLYNIAWDGVGGRIGDISDSQGGTFPAFDENYAGAGNGNLLIDTYVTDATGPGSTSFTLNLGPYGGDSFHQYGFTNEVGVPEPASITIPCFGALTLLARRRRAIAV